jgi:hypothetical protein
MTLQLLDNLWELRTNSVFFNTVTQESLGFFSSPFVVISVISSFAEPLWSKGGSVSQAIALPDTSIAWGNRKELVLNQLSLFEFPILSNNNYELFYFSLARLEAVQIKVWEYVGQTKDTAVENLVTTLETSAILTVDFSQVNVRLDAIEQAIADIEPTTVDFSPVLTVLAGIQNTASNILANTNILQSSSNAILTNLADVQNTLNDMIVKPQILLRVNGLLPNQSKEIRFWEKAEITTALKIESIFIDSPADDKVKIAVFTQANVKLTEREFDKEQTPYDFPDLVLSKSLKVVFTNWSGNPIDRVFVYCSQVPEAVTLDI